MKTLLCSFLAVALFASSHAHHCDGDIVIALDRSGSINNPPTGHPLNWDKMLNFTKDLVSALEVEDPLHDVQFGALTFSSYATATPSIRGFYLNSHGTEDDYHDAIDELYYTGGGTDIPEAIEYMDTDMFDLANGNRPGKPNVGILVTDGQSSDATAEADAAKGAPNFITMFTVGIGTGPIEDDLKAIASNDDYYFHVDDFDALEDIVAELVAKICHLGDLPCPPYNMRATCDDYLRVFYDGKEQFPPSGDTSVDEWNSATDFEVPWNTRVIAIECHNYGGPSGILADIENGLSTDGSWKCTDDWDWDWYEFEWAEPGFDDSGWRWQNAVDYGAYGSIPPGGDITWGAVTGMTPKPGLDWIWTDQPGEWRYPGSTGAEDVYCRKVSNLPGFNAIVDCDDNLEIYFDGVKKDYEPNDDVWHNASTICFPWYTKVIAIKCHNVNGPSGILGTFANDVIMTDDTWECSNQAYPGWTVGSGGWPAAVDHGAYNPMQPVGPVTYGFVTGMTPTPGLDWIWTDKPGYPAQGADQDVYCRKDLRGLTYKMTATCDDQLTVYFDGVENAYSGDWDQVTEIDVPWNTLVIGMKCHNDGGPSGILAHFANGLTTNNVSWTCSEAGPNGECECGWADPKFDATGWPAAVDHGSQPGDRFSGVPYRVVPDMPDDPHWIWTDAPGDAGDLDVCCRIYLGCDCHDV